MKRLINSLMLTIVIFTTSVYSSKADALVGLVFKNRIIKTIGAVGAIGGGSVALGTLALGAANVVQGWGALGVFVWGTFFTGLGLVILDDNTLVDIEFRPIDESNPNEFAGYSLEEVQVYNAELDLLNSIRQTIISEVDESEDTANAEALWLEYSQMLSPVTFEIAAAKARKLVESL